MNINDFVDNATKIVDIKRRVNTKIKPYQLSEFHREAYDEFVKNLECGRGLFIIGGVGIGKSLFYKAINMSLKPENRFYEFNIEGEGSLEQFFKKNGKEGMVKLVSKVRKEDGTLTHSHISDIFTERPVKHEVDGYLRSSDYEEPFVHFVMEFYRKYERGMGHRLYGDSNIGLTQLESRYGSRVWSRIMEMSGGWEVSDKFDDLRRG